MVHFHFNLFYTIFELVLTILFEIFTENPDALRRLLKPLANVGDTGRIPNWNTGGHLLLEFLDICDEVRNLFAYTIIILN